MCTLFYGMMWAEKRFFLLFKLQYVEMQTVTSKITRSDNTWPFFTWVRGYKTCVFGFESGMYTCTRLFNETAGANGRPTTGVYCCSRYYFYYCYYRRYYYIVIIIVGRSSNPRLVSPAKAQTIVPLGGPIRFGYSFTTQVALPPRWFRRIAVKK